MTLFCTGRRDERLARARDAKLRPRRSIASTYAALRVSSVPGCRRAPAGRAATLAGGRPVRRDGRRIVAGLKLDALAEQARAGLEQRQVAEHGEARRESRARPAPAKYPGRCPPARRRSRRRQVVLGSRYAARCGFRAMLSRARYRRMSTNAWARSRRAHSSRSSSALVTRICRAHWSRFTSSVVSCERRSNTWIKCQPKRDLIGWLTSFSGSSASACSNSGTDSPGEIQPKSPPSLADAVSSDTASAMVAKSSPPTICARMPMHLLLHGRLVENLGRSQQDVAHAELVHHRAFGAAHLVQADDLKSAAALDRLREIAGLHAHDEVGEQRRQLRALAPAQAAALERRLRLRRGNGEAREVFAGFEPAVDLVDPSTRRVDVLLRGIRWHADQDVRDVVVERDRTRWRVRVDEALLELARRDGDAGDDVALLELLDEQIAAAVVAIRRVVDALRCEHGRQLLERVAQILRDARQRLVQAGRR